MPGKSRFTREFARIYKDASDQATFGRPSPVFHKSRFYASAGDFSSYGIPVMLHMDCTMTAKPNHKLEILQAGEKTLREMRDIGSSIFEDEPERWGVLRCDLTADAKDVPVQWFKEHTFVAGKQTYREMGKLPIVNGYMTMRKAQAETLYAGVKPNQIRIYDKTGERMARWQRELQADLRRSRAAGAGIKPCTELGCFCGGVSLEGHMATEFFKTPSFEEMFGYKPDKIITRVERQLSGKDLEKMNLLRFDDLRVADTKKPFEKIKFAVENGHDLSIETWGFNDWHVGNSLQRQVEIWGLNETRKMMGKHLGTNAWKTWKKYEPFLVSQSKLIGTTAALLQKEFSDSTYLQIAA